MSETEVRALRNRVFDQRISDNEWNNCRHNWMNPSEVEWLKAHDFPVELAGHPMQP